MSRESQSLSAPQLVSWSHPEGWIRKPPSWLRSSGEGRTHSSAPMASKTPLEKGSKCYSCGGACYPQLGGALQPSCQILPTLFSWEGRPAKLHNLPFSQPVSYSLHLSPDTRGTPPPPPLYSLKQFLCPLQTDLHFSCRNPSLLSSEAGEVSPPWSCLFPAVPSPEAPPQRPLSPEAHCLRGMGNVREACSEHVHSMLTTFPFYR